MECFRHRLMRLWSCDHDARGLIGCSRLPCFAARHNAGSWQWFATL